MTYLGSPGFGIASAIGTNSTITPLATGATFTGTWEDNTFPEAMVSCTTDNGGTLYFDFSVDGTNVSTFPVGGFDVSSGIHEFHVAVKGPRQFRVRLVNDTGAQSYLRLYTYYGSGFTRPNAPANQSAGRDSDAALMRLYADPQDEIVLGQRSGVNHYNKFAYLPDLDTGDGAILITADPAKPALPEILTTAETFSIAFNDTTDGEGTTGALTIYFDYVDSTGVRASGTHTLSTTSPDTTSFSGLGINRVAVASSGSADINTNAITITSSSSGGVQAYVPALQGVTQQAIYHTPTDAQCVTKFLYINANKLSGSSPIVTFKGWAHNRTVDTKFEVFRHLMDTSVENTVNINEPIGFKLSAGDILYFTAETTVSNTIIGSLRFSLNEYENN